MIAVIVSGCVTVPDPDSQKPAMVTKVAKGSHPPVAANHAPATGPALEANLADAIDPCGDEMHDLAGVFFSHILAHHELPARQDFLDANLFCPVSGLKYVYVTDRLVDSNGWRLILHDATPVHHGKRWAIVDKTKPGGALVLEPILLSDAQFKAFVPALPVNGK